MGVIRWLAVSFIAATAHNAIAASLVVLIERLDNDARLCNVSESQLDSLARLTLRNNNISVDANANSSLYVNVTIARTAGSCVASYSTSIDVPATILPSSSFRPQKGHIPWASLCHKGGIMTGSTQDFYLRLSSAVEHSIKACLGSVDY
jgi:hypothetical protein